MNQFTQADKMVYDFSDFVQACDWMWYSDNLSQADVDRLPLGKEFWVLYKPHANYKQWTVVSYEVKRIYDPALKRWYRGYAVKGRVVLEQAPFPKRQEMVTSVEELEQDLLDYVAGNAPSERLQEKLKTLGSYAA